MALLNSIIERRDQRGDPTRRKNIYWQPSDLLR